MHCSEATIIVADFGVAEVRIGGVGRYIIMYSLPWLGRLISLDPDCSSDSS